MRNLRFVYQYARKHALQYMLGLLSLLVVDIIITFMPKYLGNVIDGLTDGSIVDLNGVLRWVVLIVGTGAGIALCRFFWRYFLFGSARTIEMRIRNDMFAHLETLSMQYFHNHKTGDLMAHFTNDLQSVRELLGITIITTFDASVMLVMVLTQMCLYVSPRLTIVAVIPLLLIVFGDIFYGKQMHNRFLEKQNAFSDLSDQVQESVSGIRVIKAFVQERQELAAMQRAARKCYDKNMQVARLQALVMPLLDMVIGCSSLLTLLYGGYLAIHGEITVGQFVAFNSYIGMLVWPMIAAGECITGISQGMASAARVRTIFDEQPEIVDESTPNAKQTISGAIHLEHLTFAYPGIQERNNLTDITLDIRAGETLAIVGRTGAGKSTLVNLLARLYDVPRDMISIDGQALRDYPLKALREQIAFVPQDNFLFSDSISNNIAFGMQRVDQDEVEQACRDACIHENIMDFPDGYQTIVGERGVTLSGGQKQRSSIARALLKNAPILILDDALSAVDTDTEEQILINLKKRRAGKTNIMIAHRISTIQHADHILVLEDGAMAEYGTHAELLALGGIYRGIYDRQQLEKQLEGGSEA